MGLLITRLAEIMISYEGSYPLKYALKIAEKGGKSEQEILEKLWECYA